MPAYEICYLDQKGALTHKFSADCEDDASARIVASAMKLPNCRRLEIWNGESLVYRRAPDSGTPH